jgi:predicted outer membrane protein
MILLAAAAAATASPSQAQTASESQMGEAEKSHAEKTAAIGGASLQMADIAMRRATHPNVGEFAKFEHAEQTTVAAVLKSMDPSLNPPAPPSDVTAALDKLKQMRAGTAFDREFVAAQTKGHELLRTIQERYLKTGHDQPTVNTTKLVLGMIDEHLALLSDLDRNRLASL